MTVVANEFDYVIVGAGSAGCVVAERLTRDRDITVCLLEAGGSDDKVVVRTPMLLQAAMRAKAINWNYETEPQTALNDRRLFWPRGKTLGGSSSINAMHYMRGAPENYDEWAHTYGADGWGWDAVLPVFKEHQHQTRGESALHGVDGPLWVQDIAPVNPLTDAFLEAGGQLQYPRNGDFNGERQEGFGVYQVTQKRSRRWSAADAFLRPALERDNLTVITEALVERVTLESERADGVIARIGEETRTITARREVALCGGAINSPQLLMLSGLGEASELRAAGVSPEIDLPGVGKNLQDHLDVTARIETRSPTSIGYSLRRAPKQAYDVARWMTRGDGDFTVNPVQGGAFVRSTRAGDLPDLQLVFIPAPSAPHGSEYLTGHGATLHACALYPKSRGEIRLRSSDPAEPPAIDPRYGEEEEDLEVLADGLDIVRRVLAAPAFDFDRTREVLPGPDKTNRAELIDDIRARAETLYHPTSTCAMGSDELAVVDAGLRVKGVGGLRVIDASVMPRLIGGNTNAPTMMIAARGADMILADAI